MNISKRSWWTCTDPSYGRFSCMLRKWVWGCSTSDASLLHISRTFLFECHSLIRCIYFSETMCLGILWLKGIRGLLQSLGLLRSDVQKIGFTLIFCSLTFNPIYRSHRLREPCSSITWKDLQSVSFNSKVIFSAKDFACQAQLLLSRYCYTGNVSWYVTIGHRPLWAKRSQWHL